MKLKKLLVSFLSLGLISCTTFKVGDYGPMVQLPGSKKCFQVYVLSHREVEYPKEQCEEIKKRAVLLTSETWKAISGDIKSNCQFSKCKQLRGAVDSLFIAIDAGLDVAL